MASRLGFRRRPDSDGRAVDDASTGSGPTTNEMRTEAAQERVAADRDRIERDRIERDRLAPAPPPAGRIDRDHDGVDDRVERREGLPDRMPPEAVAAAVPENAAVRVRGRTSMIATLALIFGLSGLYGALSGRLAPVGMVLAVIGLLLSFAGMRAGRPGIADRDAIGRAVRGRRTMATSAVAGGGLGTLALLVSAAGIVLAFLALNHTTAWLDSDVDQVARLRDWLNVQLPWMSDW